MIVGDNPALMTELVGGQLVVARDLVYNWRSSLLFRYVSIFNLIIDLYRAFRIAPLRSKPAFEAVLNSLRQ
jgi:hypothetical protein